MRYKVKPIRQNLNELHANSLFKIYQFQWLDIHIIFLILKKIILAFSCQYGQSGKILKPLI